ncbi:MAG: class I SAM-dependent methyltransferase, partial [Flavobacteriales bacterium]
TFHADQKGRELLVEQAVSAGAKVLDAGGGTGSTALLAAEKVSETGKVTILDLSRGMLEVARKRAVQAKLENRMEFLEGDIDNPPFPDESFDVVLSTYSACPLGDPAAGALTLLRLVKPRGLLGMAHSAAPKGFLATAIGKCVESIAWRFPSISLGCRNVDVLPALLKQGATLKFEKRIGMPYLPFEVFIVIKNNQPGNNGL